ncbi:hypothetical protein LTR62_004344 [Meristemomyces frigidus]|uniref:Uncharacterized protein n=1 Tax=Meristemomyces frigidus TaxID=1508187 RepID=A0AAN7YRF5_9PEZI|nr:hypothetical protein LTR62_004344 [Meristemomyces frigidus]
MEPAVSVVRGEFICRDTLFVHTGGEGRRASETDLTSLLGGKTPGLKDENTAKMRLLQASHQGSLKVPPHIADMEAQMKKDYAVALRKAKKGGLAAVGVARKTKRKNDEVGPENSKRITISVNIELDETESSKKSARAQSKKAAPDLRPETELTKESTKARSKEPAPDSRPKDGSKQVARRSVPNMTPDSLITWPESRNMPKYGRNAMPMTARVPVRGSPPGSAPPTKRKPATKGEPRDKNESGAKKEPGVKKEASVKKRTTIKQEAPIIRESSDNHDPRIPTGRAEVERYAREHDQLPPDPRSHPTRSALHDEHSITGVYIIDCQQLADQMPKCAPYLRLFLCLDEDMIWGGFELANKSGVLRIDEIRFDRSVSFGWRAKDEGTGRLTFGRGCFGDFELFDQDRIGGAFHNLFPETIVFQGERRFGPLWCGRSAESFRREWDGLCD